MTGNGNDEVGASDGPVVGYGKPPPQHRFKPGQSGNPRGRPRRQASFAAAFGDMLTSTTLTTINGKRRHKTVIEVAVLRAMKDILTGNPRALERWLPVIERYAPANPAVKHVDELDFDALSEEQVRAIATIKIRGRGGAK